MKCSIGFMVSLRVPAIAALLTLGAVSTAEAHHPTCKCRMLDSQTVMCTGGFSDGSKATGVVLDVIAYDERILISTRLGEDSSFTFRRPAEDFYVLLDAGPGHTVEIEHDAIK